MYLHMRICYGRIWRKENINAVKLLGRKSEKHIKGTKLKKRERNNEKKKRKRNKFNGL